MRLTLRTMLAYLDDILDSGDAHELGQKIEESKFAGDLVHRIQKSTRLLRLGAPKPEGKGMGLDPNSVAEYLDNTLPAENVPDFEKVCLESDVHLAEVASCHQILTLVLGQPADVEHAVRDRIYRVGHADETDGLADVATIDLLDEEAISSQDISLAAPRKTQRGGAAPVTGAPFSTRSVAITLVLAFLIVFAGILAVGPFNASHPLWQLVSGATPAETARDSGDAVGSPDDSKKSDTPETAPSPAAESVEVGGAAIDSPIASSLHNEPAQALPPETVPSETVPSETVPTDTVLPDTVLPDTVLPDTVLPDTVLPDTVLPKAVPSETVPLDAVPLDAVPLDAVPLDAVPLDAVPREGATEGVTSDAGAPDAVARESQIVGRYISEEQLLARYDGGAEAWLHLTPDSPLAIGNQLIVLPTYRPQILLQTGLKVILAGPTRLEIAPHDAPGLTTLQFSYGRSFLVPVGEEGAVLRLKLDSQSVDIRLPSIDSSVVVDIRNDLPPGMDGDVMERLQVVRCYVLGGQAAWQVVGGSTTLVNSGQLLVSVGGDAAAVLDLEKPSWAIADELKPIERGASHELRTRLEADRPLSLALMEQTESDRQRRVEVRALANRSLVQLGIYDTVLAALDDPRQRAYWREHFAMLKVAVSESPEADSRLREIIDRQFGKDSETIYRLIRGFSPAELAAGGAEKLVDWLEHPVMSVRVLAFLNLESITGMTRLFLPWQPPGQERDKVAKWRQSLKNGQILYRQEPTPVPELQVEATP